MLRSIVSGLPGDFRKRTTMSTLHRMLSSWLSFLLGNSLLLLAGAAAALLWANLDHDGYAAVIGTLHHTDSTQPAFTLHFVVNDVLMCFFFAMAAIATVSKRDFSFLGKFLFVGLILLIVASLANLFFQVPAVSLTVSAIAVLLFSMYLLHDVSRIVRGGETNYITATLNLFLDLFNIFISLLNLLLAFSGQRD